MGFRDLRISSDISTALSKRIHWLPWVLVLLGPILLFGPMLVRGEALFFGTPLLQFVPWRRYAYQLLSQGNLPLWNPLLGMGAPLLANYQTALLYPPNLILMVIGPEWGHGLLVAAHLVWAGFGMVVLTRRLGFKPLAQSVAGLCFCLSGYLVARGGFLSIITAAAWLPWIIVSVEQLVRLSVSERRYQAAGKAVMWVGLTLAFQWLAGHAQTAWYSLIMACIWAGWRSFGREQWKGLARTSFLMIIAGIVALVLSAVQLFPTLEYLVQSHRFDVLDPEFALTYSFWPWRLLGLVLPDLYGSPVRGDYWGYGNYWEDAIYIGILPILMALGAAWRVFRGKEDRDHLGRLLVVVGISTAILALGKNTPVFPFLFQHVPTFDLFQAPTRWNLLLVFCLAILAALGAERRGAPSGKILYWTRLGTAGAGIIGLAAWLGTQFLADVEPSFVRAFALAGVWFVLAGILRLLWRDSPSAIFSLLAGFVILLDLVVAGVGLNPSLPISVYQEESLLADAVSADHRLYMTSDIEYELKFERTHRFDSFNEGMDWGLVRDVGLPNTTILDGIPSANNFDPILPARYMTWMEMLETLQPDQRSELLALMDVGWEASLDGRVETGVRYDPIAGARRARLISEAIYVDSPDLALDRVMSPDFDPLQVVILEDAEEHVSTTDEEIGEVEVQQSSNPNEVTIRVETEAGRWLVLSDTWYPGWRAILDGDETAFYRANYLFRAVWVPPGEHLIEYQYRPLSATLGGALSLFSWIAFMCIGWRWRRD